MQSFYSNEELSELGLKKYGNNVLISRKASFYNIETIEIGENVRIDDFCILSGKIKIGSFVHVSAYCALYAKYEIEICDFCGLSPRSLVFSATDDFSGEFLINPMIPSQYTNVFGGPVRIDKYCQIGANSIIMPDLKIGEGTVTGAFTFINKSLEPWGIYVGIPARKIKDRSKKLKKYISKIIKTK